MGETMIERATRAAVEASPAAGRKGSHLRSQPMSEAAAADIARAVIASLREPSEAMIGAGADQMWERDSRDDALHCWRAMIDAILAEEPKT